MYCFILFITYNLIFTLYILSVYIVYAILFCPMILAYMALLKGNNYICRSIIISISLSPFMKESKNECDLNICFLCKNCIPEWIPAIAAHRKSFKLKKGEQIFKEGDAVNGMFFISKGTVKVHKRWDKEKDLIIRFAKTGDMLGHLGLGKDPVFPVTATALEPVVVCYVEMAFFESTLRVNPGFTYKLMRFFADELQESEKRMRNLAHMSVKARIAQAFLSLMDKFGTDKNGLIGLEITQQDISSYAGVSYETLFKVNQELKRLEIIEINGKAITIKVEERLIQIVKEDNQQ